MCITYKGNTRNPDYLHPSPAPCSDFNTAVSSTSVSRIANSPRLAKQGKTASFQCIDTELFTFASFEENAI